MKGMTINVRKGGRKIIEPKTTADERERPKDEEPRKPVRDRALDKK